MICKTAKTIIRMTAAVNRELEHRDLIAETAGLKDGSAFV